MAGILKELETDAARDLSRGQSSNIVYGRGGINQPRCYKGLCQYAFLGVPVSRQEGVDRLIGPGPNRGVDQITSFSLNS